MVGAGTRPAWQNKEKASWVEPAVPPSMVKKVDNEHGGLRVGQSVFHTKFGEGVLKTLEGKGADARAQVNFGRHGLKWLALSVAWDRVGAVREHSRWIAARITMSGSGTRSAVPIIEETKLIRSLLSAAARGKT